jgi:hypothetical protein
MTTISYDDLTAPIEAISTKQRESTTASQPKNNIPLNSLASIVSTYSGDSTPGVCRKWLNKTDQCFDLLGLKT